MSGRPTLSFCFTWMGYQRSFRPSSPGCCLRGAALELTGKMRPSTPMSPTCTLFGMPPRAMTAQFSNSNGGMTRSFSTVHGRSRTTKPRPAFQSRSLSGNAQTSRRRLAMTHRLGRNINANPHARIYSASNIFSGLSRAISFSPSSTTMLPASSTQGVSPIKTA